MCQAFLCGGDHAAGRYGDARIGSRTKWRARGSLDAPGWPTPISSITCPYGSSRSSHLDSRQRPLRLGSADCRRTQLLKVTGRTSKPSAFAECRKINSGWRIPPRQAIAGAKLHRDVLVAIRNPQWRPGYRTWLGRSRRNDIGTSFAFPRTLFQPRRLRRC